MNRKGFAITPAEVVKLALVLAFGIFAWMIYWGVREWIMMTFNLSIVASIFTGVVGLLGILILVKYNPIKFVLG